MRGTIRERLALAITLTALIPMGASIWLAQSVVRQTSGRFFVPEIGERLNQSLELYRELAHEVKQRMRAQAAQVASSSRVLAAGSEPKRLREALERELAAIEDLRELAIVRDGQTLARVSQSGVSYPQPLRLHVEQPLPRVGSLAGATLSARFVTSAKRFQELSALGRFIEAYSQIEQRRERDEGTYVLAFAVLLMLTVGAAVGAGSLLARSVAVRVVRLAEATKRVAAGDLSLRVVDSGRDEIANLAKSFNRMLAELESNRNRIEYLQRLATWQGMARRLAHEIKNPLTPIQLATEELSERYAGSDTNFRVLLNTTLEVVRSEVGTLRRLVTEFSDFARLPAAHLSPDDLFAFLRAPELSLTLEHSRGDLEIEVPAELEAPVLLDRQLMTRVVANLVNNARAAIGGAPGGRIVLGADRFAPGRVELCVDDNGPGIPEHLVRSVFDPYVTYSDGGSGLGLAIVKKIVVEHGGEVEACRGPLGGARLRIVLLLRRELADRSSDSAPAPGPALLPA